MEFNFKKNNFKNQNGTTLLEGLIASTILVVGLLGIVNLEAKLIGYGGRAEERMAANLLANELIGMAAADSPNIGCYVYPIANQTTCSNATSKSFTTNWGTRLNAELPNVTATATLDANNRFTVTIQWKQQRELFTHNYIAVTHIGG